MKLWNVLPLALTTALAACGDGDPAIVSVTANPTTVAAGGTIQMTVVLENVELEAGEAEHALTQRALRVAHGDEEAGVHLHTYLDDLESNPLAQTSSTSYAIVIPQATATGAHQLIVRLHGADHTILEPQVTSAVGITVQ